MDPYRALALEMMEGIDHHRKGPPNEDISAAMRGEMAVLRLLDLENTPMAAGEISRMLSMKTSRMAAVLGSLEKKEMILRGADPNDKRRVLVTLTQQGSAFCRQKRQAVLDRMTQMLAFLGEEDAAHLVRIVKKIHTCMQDNELSNRKEESADE